MKSKQEAEIDRAVDQAMNRWVVDAPLPPRFQERVWQRIVRTETESQVTGSFWGVLKGIIEINFPRPKFAYSYVAILILLGVAGGSWAAQRETSRLNASLESRYVHSVDPYYSVGLNQ